MTVQFPPYLHPSKESFAWSTSRSTLELVAEQRRDDVAGLGTKGPVGRCRMEHFLTPATSGSIEPLKGQTFPCRVAGQGLSPDAAMPGVNEAPRPTDTHRVSRARYTCRRWVTLTGTPDWWAICPHRPTDVLTSVIHTQFRPLSQTR